MVDNFSDVTKAPKRNKIELLRINFFRDSRHCNVNLTAWTTMQCGNDSYDRIKVWLFWGLSSRPSSPDVITISLSCEQIPACSHHVASSIKTIEVSSLGTASPRKAPPIARGAQTGGLWLVHSFGNRRPRLAVARVVLEILQHQHQTTVVWWGIMLIQTIRTAEDAADSSCGIPRLRWDN